MKNIIPFNWHKDLDIDKSESIGEDFMLLENPILSPVFDYPFKVDVTTAVICVRGSMKGSINLIEYQAVAPCLFVVLSDQILQYDYFSDDFSGLFIVMSKKFTDNLLINIQERLPLFLSVNKTPFIPLNEEELHSLTEYYAMLKRVVKIQSNPNKLEIVKHLMQAFFYTSTYNIHKLTDDKKKSKQEELVSKFMNLAQTNYKIHRELEFYADKLCLTSKYLSKVVKETTGTTAKEWIENYMVHEAKALLKSTNMTIQQISDELNFPNQSFFGKSFKRVVGISPKDYRHN
jgi:AraC-type DNA-binding domain-containing proteins